MSWTCIGFVYFCYSIYVVPHVRLCFFAIPTTTQEYRVDTGRDKGLFIGRFSAGIEKRYGNKWSLRRDGLQGRQLIAEYAGADSSPWMIILGFCDQS